MSKILIFHICVGTISVLSGAAALFFRKGSPRHRAAGNTFFVAMLCLSSTGAYLAFRRPALISVVVGILTFYFVATAWWTVKRSAGESGIFEVCACLVAVASGAGGLALGLEAANSETGFIDEIPIAAGVYFFFAVVALLAAAGDVRMIIRGGVFGAQRIARHLWRMCFALYVAAASIFVGNPQVFPEAIRGTSVLSAPVLAVLILMIFWLIRVLFTSWAGKPGDDFQRR